MSPKYAFSASTAPPKSVSPRPPAISRATSCFQSTAPVSGLSAQTRPCFCGAMRMSRPSVVVASADGRREVPVGSEYRRDSSPADTECRRDRRAAASGHPPARLRQARRPATRVHAPGADRLLPARRRGAARNILRTPVVPDVEAAAPASTRGPCRCPCGAPSRRWRARRAGERVAGAEVQRAALQVERRSHPDAGARRLEHVLAARVLADDLRQLRQSCTSSRSADRSPRRAPS